jgi:hypothetical protein
MVAEVDMGLGEIFRDVIPAPEADRSGAVVNADHEEGSEKLVGEGPQAVCTLH